MNYGQFVYTSRTSHDNLIHSLNAIIAKEGCILQDITYYWTGLFPFIFFLFFMIKKNTKKNKFLYGKSNIKLPFFNKIKKGTRFHYTFPDENENAKWKSNVLNIRYRVTFNTIQWPFAFTLDNLQLGFYAVHIKTSSLGIMVTVC